jgi:holo-[acyl-carrier protein] synthase
LRIISIGTDIIEIPRIRDVYERHGRRFIDRVYTPDEQRRLAVLRDPAPYLAGRWAVKEAVLKVLGTGLTGGITWKDIDVRRDPSGAPRVELGGKARERAAALGVEQILVSISHGREIAIAQALGVGSA